ncbi:Putative protein of unknown function [Podospora comata]|uniref:Uncharacterized protein n=1 Tax=Podospora comata TaxID=48703 RepID=A0ABY6RVR8_PODCO|nr:Putative protein of unknown function [Podospora comata]
MPCQGLDKHLISCPSRRTTPQPLKQIVDLSSFVCKPSPALLQESDIEARHLALA